MGQVALNLVAIFVFGLTFSILLGPWLSISPLVPVTIIVGILGLTTVDSLGFQGRGMTLFLDWFVQRSPQQRARILHHEAGHFLAAYVLDIPVTGYTLNAWDAFRQGYPGQGGVTFDSANFKAEFSPQLLDRYCTLWMAGMAAEHLTYGTAQGGAEDRQKLKAVTEQFRLNPEIKERWAALQAQTLLKENWIAYEALVQAMEAQASVADCCQVLEQSLPNRQQAS